MAYFIGIEYKQRTAFVFLGSVFNGALETEPILMAIKSGLPN